MSAAHVVVRGRRLEGPTGEPICGECGAPVWFFAGRWEHHADVWAGRVTLDVEGLGAEPGVLREVTVDAESAAA